VDRVERQQDPDGHHREVAVLGDDRTAVGPADDGSAVD
jgi:hypothetical protein